MKKIIGITFCACVILGPAVFAANSLEKGIHYFGKGEMAKAEKELRKAVKQFPLKAQARFYLANSLFAQKKFDESATEYEATVELDPTFKNAWNCLGILYSTRNENEKAYVALSRALQIDPAYTEALYNLGLLCLTMGRSDEAVGYFREVLKQSSKYPGVHHHLGVAYETKGLLGKAFSEYSKEIEISNNPDTHYNLGILYMERKKNFSKAKEHFQAVLAARPDDQEAQIKLNDVEKELKGE